MTTNRLRCAALLLTLTLTGCAAGRAARAGDDALERGDFEAAVAHYEEAVRQAPGDSEYQAGLTRVRTRAAQDAVARGDQARVGGDLNLAANRFQRAQQLDPRPDYAQRIAAVQQEREQVWARCAQAQQDAAAGRHEAALATLRSIEQYAPTFPEIGATLDQVSRTLCDQALSAGQDAFGRGALEEAQEHARRALGYRPADPAALALLVRVEARMRSQAACRVGGEALAQGRYREAVDAYSGALIDDPSNGAAQTGLDRSRFALADSLRRDSEVEARAGRDGRALALMREAAALPPVGPVRADLEARVQAIVERVAGRLEGRGDAALRANLAGAAWAYYRAATRLRGVERRPAPDLSGLLTYRVELVATGGPLAAATLADLAAALSRAVPPEVQLLGAGAPADAQLRLVVNGPRFDHVVAQVEQRAVDYVERIDWVRNPRHQQLRHRAGQLEDRKRELDARVDGERGGARVREQALERAERELARAKEQSRADARRRAEALQREAAAESTRAAALAVEVNRLEKGLTEQRGGLRSKSPSERQALQPQVANGEKRLAALRKQLEEANHKAEALLQQARELTENPPASDAQRRAEAERERARRDLSEFQARVLGPLQAERERVGQELRATRQELDATPGRVQQPVHATFTYGVEHHVLTADAGELLTLHDSLGNTERLRLEASAQTLARDTSFPGARIRGEPDLYLEPDPLQLPSDQELARALAGELASRVFEPAARALQEHRGRFLTAARRAQGDARVHFWVLAAQTGATLDAPAQEEARAAIYQGCALDIASDAVDLEQVDRL